MISGQTSVEKSNEDILLKEKKAKKKNNPYFNVVESSAMYLKSPKKISIAA
jgi:hypothetical protein